MSLLGQKAEVVYIRDEIDEVQIKDFIKDLGFGAEILEAAAGEHTVEIQVFIF